MRFFSSSVIVTFFCFSFLLFFSSSSSSSLFFIIVHPWYQTKKSSADAFTVFWYSAGARLKGGRYPGREYRVISTISRRGCRRVKARGYEGGLRRGVGGRMFRGKWVLYHNVFLEEQRLGIGF